LLKESEDLWRHPYPIAILDSLNIQNTRGQENIRAIIDRSSEGRRPDSEDPVVVVPTDVNGKHVRSGGWTEPAPNENYKPLIDAGRKQDLNADDAVAKANSKT
jgi:hypothetical protein